ncbi:sugar porter family MFS transporter [Maribellus sp. YY47]|uniref:sugar porter family MFS transporter n=1 Tax=Maribellus sp. YY47 TaxID=2929486 RepID=UPI002000D7A1|nr:sugar porter family MFS transporter [Maribellus sp. YY47]MCK3685568.1 sugar porter family MFS transporter [Maribellus sp. YY47]
MKLNNRLINWMTFVAVNGGLLFGLNMAGISGAITGVQDFFELNQMQTGLAVSSIMIGCLVGALVAGSFGDKYGRKRTMFITAFLFVLSALLCSISHRFSLFVFARILGGLAVGASSVIVPTYITEIAPAERRGTLVSFYQMAIVTGILFAYIIDYVLFRIGYGWRFMLGVPLVFGVIYLLLLTASFFESPRWLIKAGRKSDAQEILFKIGGAQYAMDEMSNLETSDETNDSNKKVKISSIFKGKLGYVLLLGTLLAAFQQITGINVVINYAPVIFQQAGVGINDALLQSIVVGIVNFVFTIVAVWLVDKKGRKILLLWGAAGMTLSLSFLAASFFSQNSGDIGMVISVLVYIAFFAASLAPVMWVVTSEMYPTSIRGTAMSFSTSISWICSLLVVQFFPWMMSSFGGVVTFGVLALLSLLAFLFIKFFIPETKGKSLEEIEKELGLAK